jgi:hypothetical protein
MHVFGVNSFIFKVCFYERRENVMRYPTNLLNFDLKFYNQNCSKLVGIKVFHKKRGLCKILGCNVNRGSLLFECIFQSEGEKTSFFIDAFAYKDWDYFEFESKETIEFFLTWIELSSTKFLDRVNYFKSIEEENENRRKVLASLYNSLKKRYDKSLSHGFFCSRQIALCQEKKYAVQVLECPICKELMIVGLNYGETNFKCFSCDSQLVVNFDFSFPESCLKKNGGANSRMRSPYEPVFLPPSEKLESFPSEEILPIELPSEIGEGSNIIYVHPNIPEKVKDLLEKHFAAGKWMRAEDVKRAQDHIRYEYSEDEEDEFDEMDRMYEYAKIQEDDYIANEKEGEVASKWSKDSDDLLEEDFEFHFGGPD